jgi:hypothetical protein
LLRIFCGDRDTAIALQYTGVWRPTSTDQRRRAGWSGVAFRHRHDGEIASPQSRAEGLRTVTNLRAKRQIRPLPITQNPH